MGNKKLKVSDFKIGDWVRIKNKPEFWASFLCDNRPLEETYPFQGKIEDIKDDDGAYYAAKIGGFGFYLSHLIAANNISIIKEPITHEGLLARGYEKISIDGNYYRIPTSGDTVRICTSSRPAGYSLYNEVLFTDIEDSIEEIDRVFNLKRRTPITPELLIIRGFVRDKEDEDFYWLYNGSSGIIMRSDIIRYSLEGDWDFHDMENSIEKVDEIFKDYYTKKEPKRSLPSDTLMSVQSECSKDCKKENILQIAESLIYGDRMEQYGNVKEDFTRISGMWSIILKTTVTPEQAVLCMIALKLCRESNQHKMDNLIDCAGYAGCIEKMLKNK